MVDAIEIRRVRNVADLEAVTRLFRAYAGSLAVDLAYQGFEGELAALPGNYAPPAGELLLARNTQGTAMGCVALRPLDVEGCCEMKRLYVAQEGRGSGLGQALVDALIVAAEGIGYSEIRLDTLPFMKAAQALYRRSGFEVIKAYYDSPVAGTVFMRRRLEGQGLAGR